MVWMRCPIDAQCKSRALAIWTEKVQLTYQELNALINRLSPRDLRSGQPVAFIASKTIETIAFLFALWRQGKIAFPLSPRLPDIAVQNVLQKAGAILYRPSLKPARRGNTKLDLLKPATLFLTSGTTSEPKTACHTLSNHFHNAYGAIALLNLKAGDSYLLDLPLNHVGGLAAVLRTFLAGGTLLFPPLFEQATHCSLVPTQLLRFIQNQTLFPRSKCLLIGGAALPRPLLHEAKKRGFPIYESYGMTEMSSMIALQNPEEGATQLLPGTKLSIINGEIHTQGPTLFQGYYKADGSLSLPLTQGWFATGDLGTLTPEGILRLKGRKDRQFISGGENIQPEEIEAILLSMPHIIEAYVRPQADKELGQRATAALFCDEAIDLKKIEKELRKQLPGYKIPKEWHFLSHPLKGI